MKDIPKVYNPSDYEDKIYQKWEKSGFFNPDNLKLKKGADYFSLSMPPPNVTGILHLGHALENAIMDTTIRYQRMRGKKAVLIPGTDHAAIATQAKVEKDLIKSGVKDPRRELGREKLLEIIRDYSEKSKATILSQVRKMGTSADWSRLAYTFDEERSRAVNQVFIKMYKDSLIYRGYRVVNWSVKGQSTCSDDELIYVERDAKFYTFKYSKDFPIAISTTRPETKLGDTAVAVNPKDERYKKYIGQEILVKKFGGSVDLRIKVIADENVDPSFGTGAVGVTPAHSMIDYEMYQKSGEIGFVQVIDKNDLMTLKAGEEYNGLPIETARGKVIQWLKKNDLLIKEEEIKQNVGTSDRFGDVVEVLPMMQWFVDVNKKIPGKNKSLKELMIEAVKVGHNSKAKQKIRINPKRFEKIYFNWINNLRDWCISRQIWWGHRIPVWYDLTSDEYEKYKNNSTLFGNFLNYTQPKRYAVGFKKPDIDGNWLQDPDTLDTWFSSGLWTFSTLGWPDNIDKKGKKISDLKEYHPTTWMQMGYEIIFFWMARMILMSTYVLDEIPFKDVYIHGILRDKEGRKFSKSLDNGIDPIEIINKYGADALRLSLLSSVAPGNDMRFYEEKVEGARNFVNKFWNIFRYIWVFFLDGNFFNNIQYKKNKKWTLSDKWIFSRISWLKVEATKCLDKYDFSKARELLYDFTWNEFADWYIEISKIEKHKEKNVAFTSVMNDLLKMWHPFMPFITEKIWSIIYDEGKEEHKNKFLMIEKWPLSDVYGSWYNKKIESEFNLIKNIIVAIRNLRAEYKIEPVKKLNVIISAGTKKKILEENAAIIKGLRTGIGELKIEKKVAKPKGWIELDAGVYIYIDLAGAVDIVKESERIKKEIGETEKYVKSLASKLNNKEFLTKAPKEIVESEKEKLKQAQEKLANLEKQIKILE